MAEDGPEGGAAGAATGRPVVPSPTAASPAPGAAWRILGASLAGSSHLAAGLPCQDAHGWRELPGGVWLAAVADGAGSAPRSDEGAALAVDAALEALAAAADRGALPARIAEPEAPQRQAAAPAGTPDGVPDRIPEKIAATEGNIPAADLDRSSLLPEQHPWAQALRLAFGAAREALLAHAAAEGIPLRDLACTLAIAAGDGAAVVAAQIGDGAVLAQGPGGAWLSLLPGQKGEYANEVLFLHAPDALDHVAPCRFARPRAVVLSTDGLLRLMLRYPGGEPHAPFLEPLVAFAAGAADAAAARRQLLGFLGSERVCARTDDDKTLVIVLPGGDGPGDERQDRAA